MICAADKVARVREQRTLVAHDHRGADPSPEEVVDKLEHYAATLEMLEEFIPEQPIVRQLRFELEALATYPPAGIRPVASRTIAHEMRGHARRHEQRY